jgi:DNA-binding NarL/FixJ family response regulator
MTNKRGQVVGEAGDGREALALVASQRPDLVLMDIAMPEMNGLEATARIAKTHPHVRVIILSVHPNEDYVWKAQRIGAAGYLLKDAPVLARLQECGVQGGPADLRCFRDPKQAQKLDGRGELMMDAFTSGDAVELSFSHRELFDVRVDFE